MANICQAAQDVMKEGMLKILTDITRAQAHKSLIQLKGNIMVQLGNGFKIKLTVKQESKMQGATVMVTGDLSTKVISPDSKNPCKKTTPGKSKKTTFAGEDSSGPADSTYILQKSETVDDAEKAEQNPPVTFGLVPKVKAETETSPAFDQDVEVAAPGPPSTNLKTSNNTTGKKRTPAENSPREADTSAVMKVERNIPDESFEQQPNSELPSSEASPATNATTVSVTPCTPSPPPKKRKTEVKCQECLIETSFSSVAQHVEHVKQVHPAIYENNKAEALAKRRKADAKRKEKKRQEMKKNS